MNNYLFYEIKRILICSARQLKETFENVFTWIKSLRRKLLQLPDLNFLKEKSYLTKVESLEASVISRFPLSPKSAGTRMKSSLISLKTVQCCTVSNTMPAPTIPRPAIKNGKKILNRQIKSLKMTADSILVTMFQNL